MFKYYKTIKEAIIKFFNKDYCYHEIEYHEVPIKEIHPCIYRSEIGKCKKCNQCFYK